MEVSGHIKTRWTIRGDYTRTATDAWTNGVEVRLPNYDYGSARYDTESEIVLLSNGGKITTALTRFDHIKVIPLEEVRCRDCKSEFVRSEECPSCGSILWEAR